MERPRFQFTIGRAMLPAIWIAACIGSWAFAMPGHKWPEPLSFLFAFLAIGGPFAAVGSWFGRT
jgi:hypothetical protein